jgi:hypothetical protein
MSQNHPDKLAARGVPDDMLKLATEKSQEIQAAYEMVRQSRGSRLEPAAVTQLRQNIGVNSTSSVNTSRRPSSIATQSTDLATSLMAP